MALPLRRDRLIAEKDGVLMFVEVKLRTNLQYGAPREYVTVKKQEKLQKERVRWRKKLRRRHQRWQKRLRIK